MLSQSQVKAYQVATVLSFIGRSSGFIYLSVKDFKEEPCASCILCVSSYLELNLCVSALDVSPSPKEQKPGMYVPSCFSHAALLWESKIVQFVRSSVVTTTSDR